MNHKNIKATLLVATALGAFATNTYSQQNGIEQFELQKLRYNNPDLLVDLDVGFKSVPLPMDFDGDGDYDLLVSESGSYVEAGVFYFENISGNVEMPVFRQGMKVSSPRFRLGLDGACFEVSQVNGHTHVLTPDRVNQQLLIYRDVPQNVFWAKERVSLSITDHVAKSKFNVWKMIDFDGDGVVDLMCGLSSSLLFFKNLGSDSEPSYAKPIEILNEKGDSIGQGLNVRTLLADFDNDGDFDFVGVGSFGNFTYFENIGSKDEHKYANGKKIMFHGEELRLVTQYGNATRPTAFDWDRDGFPDILVGDEDGKVSFLKNTGRMVDGIPEFQAPRFFQQKAKYVDLGALAAPRIYDWDGDGLEDIVSGNAVGNIIFLKNLGGKEPHWAAPELLRADGNEILLLPPGANWGYVTIDVGDWNHDDLPDVLANDFEGNVVWFENIGTAKEPRLTTEMPIEVQWQDKPLRPEWVPGSAKGNELLAPWRTSPLIMDFNDDGLNDLVMLDHEGYLAVYLRYQDKQGRLLLAHPKRNFVFPSGEPILLNQRTGSSSGRLKITFVDWDGDGLDDLIFSSKPAVDWMKNMGMVSDKIVLKYMGRVTSPTLMGHTDGPTVADWNQDGVPDLVVGTETGVLYYWERTRFNHTTTMTTVGVQKPAQYPYFKR